MPKVSLQINIQSIRIAEVDTGSALAIGNNYFIDWQTHNKMNNGFGRLNGDQGSFEKAFFKVDDPDLNDMLCGEKAEEKADDTTRNLIGHDLL
jgi:hypothetical protein